MSCWAAGQSSASLQGVFARREKKCQEEAQKRCEEEAAKTEMEKFLAELHSKEQVEVEKHRLTLEAQRPKQGEVC